MGGVEGLILVVGLVLYLAIRSVSQQIDRLHRRVDGLADRVFPEPDEDEHDDDV